MLGKAFLLAIEGSIAVGKTSLARLITERLEARLVLEDFQDNPFLEDFYRKPELYAFQTQLWFLLSRYRQQQELQQIDLFAPLLVTDYMFMKDRIFASLTLNDREMILYDRVANLLEREVAMPDLVIYLQSDTDRLMANIKKRGRSYETGIDWNYLDSLNQLYNEYFFRYTRSPLLIINTNDIDFVNSQSDFDEIITFIRKPVTGTRFFNPTRSF
ncbi:MAG: deoxynucleoside kinase [Candidatus Marinimicrobia bacterium]|nr:deoxynucleoside kinase [Candidatus Neomarinimicrobiota bacterium]